MLDRDLAPPVLDWHPPDPSRRVPQARWSVSALPDFDLDQPLAYRMRRKYVWLDQGDTPGCTGFGAGNALAEYPYRKTPITNELCRRIYAGAKRHDEWAGESYDGSSVQGAMSFLLAESTYLRDYWWCRTPDELAHAVSLRAAVEVGTWWYSGMWDTDAAGFVHATGTREGGHAYCIGGVDPAKRRYRIDQSWGRWGIDGGGSAWISMDDLHRLVFDEDGEAAMPRKRATGGALA